MIFQHKMSDNKIEQRFGGFKMPLSISNVKSQKHREDVALLFVDYFILRVF